MPQQYPANPTLGRWIKKQQNSYKLYQEGKPSPMTAEHIRELDRVGFHLGASKIGLTSAWSERFAQLLEFKVQFGHCLVPQRYAANPKLGQWVATQRSNCRKYQEGKPSCMTEDRIRTLDGIGFDWGEAKLRWHPLGANALNNCLNSRYNSVTASCHNSTLPTPRSGSGLRNSDAAISCIRKENQVP